ncbi:hypothetical protein CAEBREN_00546 [Caenorhabditis brenneri]|uniref:Uncharacterized protein n=1 Tax=Caenorhabditis brenneri TaxID=135651 RepID=G0NMQ7_CAEBE|nr:hypothetical protein CAEBREN_00546 [Caenorhabditis brenneri]
MTDETTSTTGDITNADPPSKNTSVSLTMSTLATTTTITDTKTGNSSGMKPVDSERPLRNNRKDKKRKKTKKIRKDRQLKKELDPKWEENFKEEVTETPAESRLSFWDVVQLEITLGLSVIVISVGVPVLLAAADIVDIYDIHDGLFKLDKE